MDAQRLVPRENIFGSALFVSCQRGERHKLQPPNFNRQTYEAWTTCKPNRDRTITCLTVKGDDNPCSLGSRSLQYRHCLSNGRTCCDDVVHDQNALTLRKVSTSSKQAGQRLNKGGEPRTRQRKKSAEDSQLKRQQNERPSNGDITQTTQGLYK